MPRYSRLMRALHRWVCTNNGFTLNLWVLHRVDALATRKDCSMNRFVHLIASFFTTNRHGASVRTARALFERATHARGQSRFEAAQLRANAQAMLSVVR